MLVSTYICVNFMHIYVSISLHHWIYSFFIKMTSGLHRCPFEGRHLVLNYNLKICMFGSTIIYLLLKLMNLSLQWLHNVFFSISILHNNIYFIWMLLRRMKWIVQLIWCSYIWYKNINEGVWRASSGSGNLFG